MISLAKAYNPAQESGRWQYEDGTQLELATLAVGVTRGGNQRGSQGYSYACFQHSSQEKLGEGGLAVVYRARDAPCLLQRKGAAFRTDAERGEVWFCCFPGSQVSGSLGEVAVKVSKFKNLPLVAWLQRCCTKAGIGV